jgi:hypothetical protein
MRDLPPVPYKAPVTDNSGLPSRAWATWFEQLSNIISEKTSSGYQRLPGGLIVQWGITGSLNSASTNTITFPLEFPTLCLQVIAGLRNISAAATTDTGHFGTGNYAVTGFDLYNRTSAAAVFNWIAIGY